LSGKNYGYLVAPVLTATTLKDLADEHSVSFVHGYYQITTLTEDVKKNKLLVLIKGNECYDDPTDCRKKLGLKPNVDAKFKANINPNYTIFVQSTSTGRNLRPGTQALFSVPLSQVPQGGKQQGKVSKQVEPQKKTPKGGVTSRKQRLRAKRQNGRQRKSQMTRNRRKANKSQRRGRDLSISLRTARNKCLGTS